MRRALASCLPPSCPPSSSRASTTPSCTWVGPRSLAACSVARLPRCPARAAGVAMLICAWLVHRMLGSLHRAFVPYADIWAPACPACTAPPTRHASCFARPARAAVRRHQLPGLRVAHHHWLRRHPLCPDHLAAVRAFCGPCWRRCPGRVPRHGKSARTVVPR